MRFIRHALNFNINKITLVKGFIPIDNESFDFFSVVLNNIKICTLNNVKTYVPEGSYQVDDFLIAENLPKNLNLTIAYFDHFFCHGNFNLAKFFLCQEANCLTQNEITQDLELLDQIIYWLGSINEESMLDCNDEEFLEIKDKYEDFSLEWSDYVKGLRQVYMLLSWLRNKPQKALNQLKCNYFIIN